MKTKRLVKVRVEELDERYCGTPTGRRVFHVSEFGCTTGLFRGCPLGRGYTEAEALADFCYRANADDTSLKLRKDELLISDRRSYNASK